MAPSNKRNVNAKDLCVHLCVVFWGQGLTM